ncbi:hypothetical protein Kpho01_58210 [Kitasatospora phosalacinea]|uniref:Uncharacterized protein n=1 Tax=Kitasatospora phosalacinea TaxID=2065 RepID=A0A9W6USQ0_9ACTN|nr:hypothetical protein Kpho01_58210 [Kitasatospora phosalacinea]
MLRLQRAAVRDQGVGPLLGLPDLPAAGVPAGLLEGGGHVGRETGLGADGAGVQGVLRRFGDRAGCALGGAR